MIEMAYQHYVVLFCLSVPPSVCLSVTLVNDPRRNGSHIEMPFAPYDRAMLDARSFYGS